MTATTESAAVANDESVGSGKIKKRRSVYPWVSVISLLAMIGLWQLLVSAGAVSTQVMSSPSQVWHTAGQVISNGTLGSAFGDSAKLYLTGLGISIVVGVPAGIIFGYWRFIGAIFDPLIAILYATPLIALLPLVLVWFGISFKAQVVMVLLVAIFPIIITTMNGVRELDPDLLRVAKSFRASQWSIIRTLLFPSLLPYIVTGLRLSMGLGLIGVVVSEYYLGESGLGGFIMQAGSINDTSQVMVGILVLALSSVLLTALIKWVERRVTPWRP
ncbi:MAG: ABC transporter permease [Streptosporangiaceae bacterium]|jgi:ABC-type nitrate/sulfonate/bicarbonate transport system permease component